MKAPRKPLAVTQADIEKSYVVLEMLEVIAHACRNIDQAGDPGSLGNSIAYCLDHVGSLASGIHIILERADIEGRKP